MAIRFDWCIKLFSCFLMKPRDDISERIPFIPQTPPTKAIHDSSDDIPAEATPLTPLISLADAKLADDCIEYQERIGHIFDTLRALYTVTPPPKPIKSKALKNLFTKLEKGTALYPPCAPFLMQKIADLCPALPKTEKKHFLTLFPLKWLKYDDEDALHEVSHRYEQHKQSTKDHWEKKFSDYWENQYHPLMHGWPLCADNDMTQMSTVVFLKTISAPFLEFYLDHEPLERFQLNCNTIAAFFHNHDLPHLDKKFKILMNWYTKYHHQMAKGKDGWNLFIILCTAYRLISHVKNFPITQSHMEEWVSKNGMSWEDFVNVIKTERRSPLSEEEEQQLRPFFRKYPFERACCL